MIAQETQPQTFISRKQIKKATGAPLGSKFSSCQGLSSPLSWKWCSATLSPSFGLFQSEKALFQGVPGVCHCLSLVSICPRDPSPCRKKEICSSGKNEHGTAKFVNSFISLFRSFSLRHSENTFISALQGPGDKETPKNHHPKGFWSSRDSLTNHLTPLCACTHTYPCVLGPLHSPLTLEFNFFNWYNHPVS